MFGYVGFLIAEMLDVVWLSKFSTIIANPASSTEGSFGFRRFHLSKPTVAQSVHHGKEWFNVLQGANHLKNF